MIVTHEPTSATPSKTAVTPDGGNSDNHLTTAESATVTATATPRNPSAKTTTVTDTNTTVAVSQPRPVVRT